MFNILWFCRISSSSANIKSYQQVVIWIRINYTKYTNWSRLPINEPTTEWGLNSSQTMEILSQSEKVL